MLKCRKEFYGRSRSYKNRLLILTTRQNIEVIISRKINNVKQNSRLFQSVPRGKKNSPPPSSVVSDQLIVFSNSSFKSYGLYNHLPNRAPPHPLSRERKPMCETSSSTTTEIKKMHPLLVCGPTSFDSLPAPQVNTLMP